jgi:ribose/xylose/arabinose/galactoside ABC-type transport system permease subunit
MTAFDRSYARGPWRVLPVPAHLSDRRAAVVFQLGWAGALAVLVTLAAWIADRQLQGSLFSAGSPALVVSEALPLLLTAIGMAVVFARGGFDLSVGSISSLAAIVAVKTGNPWLALFAALACGLANGMLVGLLRVPGWLVTAFTVALIHRLDSALLMGAPLSRLRDPASMDWALSAAPLVAIGAGVVAFLWTQLLPAGAPGRGRVRLFVGDALLPYLFSAGLAAMAGFTIAARVRGAGTGPSEWLDLALAVVVGGTFLGAGRANVLGAVVAALGVGVLRSVFIVSGAPHGGLVQHAILLLGVATSFGAHALAARRFTRARADAEPAPARLEPVPRIYDRALFQGPGRVVPVPVHLTDRRCALRVELVWSAVLLVVFASVLAPAVVSKAAGWASFSFLGPQLVVPLLLTLGASAVVARGGFDLSALAVMALASQLGALRADPWLALAAALAVGLLNGGLVVLLRVPGWIATFTTAFLVQLTGSRFVGNLRIFRLSDDAMRWVPTASVAVLGVAIVVAVAWLQLLPGRPPAGRAAPWRERIADGLPYVFSSALAGVAGVYLLARITGLAGQLTVGEETLTSLILAGCWLGAGRANVVGVLVAVLGTVSLEFHVMTGQSHPSVVVAVLAGSALVALAASRVVHRVVGQAHARSALRASEDEPLTTPG